MNLVFLEIDKFRKDIGNRSYGMVPLVMMNLSGYRISICSLPMAIAFFISVNDPFRGHPATDDGYVDSLTRVRT